MERSYIIEINEASGSFDWVYFRRKGVGMVGFGGFGFGTSRIVERSV